MNKKIKFIGIAFLCAFAYIGFSVTNWLLHILCPLFVATIIVYLYLKFNKAKQKNENLSSFKEDEVSVDENKKETIDDLLSQIENERKL